MRIAEAGNETRETTLTESNSDSNSLRAALQEISAQLAKLAQRVSGLEELASMGGSESVPSAIAIDLPVQVAETPSITPSVAATAGISDSELLAISAALAAWLGVHAHIRQIRLIRTGAWAQQGRVTIQASHRLNH